MSIDPRPDKTSGEGPAPPSSSGRPAVARGAASATAHPRADLGDAAPPVAPRSTRAGPASAGPRSSRSEVTRPGLRAVEGRMCPRCRHHVDGDVVPPGPVARCPSDGVALVPVAEILGADGDPFLGATIAGRFVVLGRLGAGSMGTVYRARQEAMGRDVAVKVLRGDRAEGALPRQRFAREARAMSLLTSPYTVTVFDFGEIPDPGGDDLAGGGTSLFLAMELLEGESLGARLKRRGALSVAEAAQVARQALLSLAEAHEKGIIHRDLKPDNLYLARLGGPQPGEIVKVLDFGIAKLTTEHAGVDALETQAGTVFGTPRYMSPEQAQGRALDARSDLYTLGVLLYQMLVGRPPFTDDDAVVVMARHIQSTPVPPSEAAPGAGIPPALSALVMRALAKDPLERPESARRFLAELDGVVGKQGPHGGGWVGGGARVDDVGAIDGVDASPGQARGLPPARAATLVGLTTVIAVLLGLAAVGALMPSRGPSLVRGGIAKLVLARRLGVARAPAPLPAAVESAAPAAPVEATGPWEPPTEAPRPAPAPRPGKKSERRYKRIE